MKYGSRTNRNYYTETFYCILDRLIVLHVAEKHYTFHSTFAADSYCYVYPKEIGSLAME